MLGAGHAGEPHSAQGPRLEAWVRGPSFNLASHAFFLCFLVGSELRFKGLVLVACSDESELGFCIRMPTEMPTGQLGFRVRMFQGQLEPLQSNNFPSAPTTATGYTNKEGVGNPNP